MLNLTKMNGNGNDFLVLNNMDLKFPTERLIALAVNLCRRREALGADGLLVIEPSEKSSFKMRLINKDSSEAEMCGNGARCAARYAFEEGLAESEMFFETLAGPIKAKVDGRIASIELNRVDVKTALLEREISIEGEAFRYSFLTVGVPHAVIFEAEKHSCEEYANIGRAIRNKFEIFPNGTNVSFAVKSKENCFDAVTYERGVEALTLSCGTGSAAVAVSAWLTKRSGEDVEIINPGGVNRVRLLRDGDFITPTLEGLTVRAAEITVADEILQ